MRTKTWSKAALGVATLCLASLPLCAQQPSSSQQSGSDAVADAARKARDDKKNAVKPKKVYTEDDVKPANTPATENPAAAGVAAGAATQQKPGEPGAVEDPNGEAAWRKRFKEQQDKITKAQTELDVLQRELQKAQTQYYPDPQKAMTEQNSRKEVNDKLAKIDAKKQEIGQLKQGLTDMEDQLRKSGGDPGWAR